MWRLDTDPHYNRPAKMMDSWLGRVLYELDKWVQAFSDARVVRCPEAGHFVQEEEPTLMIEELKGFLK